MRARFVYHSKYYLLRISINASSLPDISGTTSPARWQATPRRQDRLRLLIMLCCVERALTNRSPAGSHWEARGDTWSRGGWTLFICIHTPAPVHTSELDAADEVGLWLGQGKRDYPHRQRHGATLILAAAAAAGWTSFLYPIAFNCRK